MAEEYDYKYADGPKNWLEKPDVKDGPMAINATYPNGNTFVGTYVAKVDAPAPQTEGPAREVVKEGQGTYTWSFKAEDAEDDEGKKKVVCQYEGSWKDGKKSGLGKMSFPNGDTYHGLWEAGKRHGQGTYTYKNGDIYSGGWENDKKHGSGAYEYAKDQSQMIGTWVQGKYTEGKWFYQNGSYQGAFKDTKFVGKGTFQFSHGKRIETGQWIETTGENADGDVVKSAFWRSSLAPEPSGAPPPPEVEDDE